MSSLLVTVWAAALAQSVGSPDVSLAAFAGGVLWHGLQRVTQMCDGR